MFCYNCGTDCKEDRFCSNCGCRVGKPEEREKIYPDPPLGVYRHYGGFLEIQRKCLRINHHTNEVSFDYCIDYEDISQVQVIPASPRKKGMLSIRRKGSVSKMPQTVMPGREYESAKFYHIYSTEYEKIYEFLSACASINNAKENESK